MEELHQILAAEPVDDTHVRVTFDTGAFGVSRWRSYKNNVEVLRGNAEYAIQPSNNTPTFDVNILLNGVCDVNGEPLLK